MKLPSLPETAALADVFAAFPAGVPELMAFVEAVMRAPGELDIAERELIAAYVSAGNACSFCYGSHKIYAEAFGIDEGVIEALVRDIDTADVTPRLKALLRYVFRLKEQPSRLVQADVDEVLGAGWSEAALVEAVRVAALFHMMNRIVDGTGVSFDPLTAPELHPATQLGDRAREHHFVAAGRGR